MLIRIHKEGYNLVVSDSGKRIRVKGKEQTYSKGTEYPDKPIEYEEVDE